MPSIISLPLLSLVLVAGLLFPPLSPYTAVYVVLIGLLIALVLLSQRHWEVFGIGPFRLVWLAVLLLSATLPLAYQSANDLFVFAALAPVFMAPAVTILLHEEPRFSTPWVIGFLCFAGAVGAAIVALNEVFGMGLARASGGNNAIHFGGLSVILGYMSLIGLFGSRSPWRFILIAGPVLGTLVTVLSGSRGPVLSAVILAIAVSPFLVVWFWRELTFKIAVSIIILGLAGVFSQTDVSYFKRTANLVDDIIAIVANDGKVDLATQERLVMYEAAFAAFKEAPFFGHGSGQISVATGSHMPEAFTHLRRPEHLHSDIADFAVIGGGVGLVAYFCLLAAPLFAFRNATLPETRRAILLGGIILSVGYFSLGLTNAMFGILPQTMLFGLLLGALVGLATSSPTLQPNRRTQRRSNV